MKRFMGYSARQNGLGLALVLALQLSAPETIGDVSNGAISEAVNAYLTDAFGASEKRLNRIANYQNPTLRTVCKSEDSTRCTRAIMSQRVIDTGILNDRFRPRYSSDPDIEIIFIESKFVEHQRSKLLNRYSDDFVDANDLECQLYYSADIFEITNVTIVVSLDASKRKQVACIASHIYQGIGLELSAGWKFPEAWENSLKAMTDFEFYGYLGGLKVASYIHLCAMLKPGMSKQQAKEFLTETSECLSGLYIKKSTDL